MLMFLAAKRDGPAAADDDSGIMAMDGAQERWDGNWNLSDCFTPAAAADRGGQSARLTAADRKTFDAGS